MKQYSTFQEFYPYYLSQHANQTNRRLHIIGSTLAILQLIRSILFLQLSGIFYSLLIGYGFAWVGHFFFQKNKPATFKYPLFSVRGDLKMLIQTYTGQRKF